MNERVGLLTKEQEELIADLIDKAVKAGWLEFVDDKIIAYLLKLIDDKLLEKHIPDNWKNPLLPIIDAILIKDWDETEELTIVAMQEAINLDWLDDDLEDLAIAGLIKGIMSLILIAVQKIK